MMCYSAIKHQKRCSGNIDIHHIYECDILKVMFKLIINLHSLGAESSTHQVQSTGCGPMRLLKPQSKAPSCREWRPKSHHCFAFFESVFMPHNTYPSLKLKWKQNYTPHNHFRLKIFRLIKDLHPSWEFLGFRKRNPNFILCCTLKRSDSFCYCFLKNEVDDSIREHSTRNKQLKLKMQKHRPNHNINVLIKSQIYMNLRCFYRSSCISCCGENSKEDRKYLQLTDFLNSIPKNPLEWGGCFSHSLTAERDCCKDENKIFTLTTGYQHSCPVVTQSSSLGQNHRVVSMRGAARPGHNLVRHKWFCLNTIKIIIKIIKTHDLLCLMADSKTTEQRTLKGKA